MPEITKSQKRLLIVLLIVIVVVSFDVLKNWDLYFGFYKKSNDKKNVVKIPTSTAVKKDASIKEIVYNKSWKNDPFYVPVQRKTIQKRVKRSRTVLKLNAISYAGENSVAMINNRILKKGDAISGYKVTRIESKRVTLYKNGQRKVLSLK